jgi:acyl carrier protein
VSDVINREQGVEVVRTIVADCLALELAEARPESRLVTDLGADSLDFIDLVFTLEKRFGLRMRENEMDLMGRREPMGQGTGSAAEFLSDEAIARVLPWLPELATDRDLKRVRPVDILPLVTVEALWRLVEVQMRNAPGHKSGIVGNAPQKLAIDVPGAGRADEE